MEKLVLYDISPNKLEVLSKKEKRDKEFILWVKSQREKTTSHNPKNKRQLDN